MDTLIETFHLDVKLLIAQIINFAIVFFVLYKFALKPLLGTMQDRTAQIEKGLADAKKTEEKLAQTESAYEEKMEQARLKAEKVIEDAGLKGEEKRKEMLEKTRAEIGVIINQEKEQIRQEKEKTLKEIKAEVSDLIIASLEKVLDSELNADKEKELIKKVLS